MIEPDRVGKTFSLSSDGYKEKIIYPEIKHFRFISGLFVNVKGGASTFLQIRIDSDALTSPYSGVAKLGETTTDEEWRVVQGFDELLTIPKGCVMELVLQDEASTAHDCEIVAYANRVLL